MAEIKQLNFRILAWARETAGLSLEEAADKLGLEVSACGTGAEKLGAREARQREAHRTAAAARTRAYLDRRQRR
jgi:hypothetical protein